MSDFMISDIKILYYLYDPLPFRSTIIKGEQSLGKGKNNASGV